MMFQTIQTCKFLFIVTAVTVAAACSGSKHANIERAAEYNNSAQYSKEDGHPELWISAMGFLKEDGEGIISVTADIENRSLIFRHLDGKTTADIEFTITVIETEKQQIVDSYTASKTIENDSYSHIISSNVTRYEKDMRVPPGNYKVFFTITDKASGSQTVREAKTSVPDPGEEIVSLTSVQLFSKNSDEPEQDYEPVTTYDISAKSDSIRFVLQIANTRPEETLTIRSRLVRFEADTSVARLASYTNYSVSSLPYKGVDYSREENLEQTQRILDQQGVVMIEFHFKRPERGNYRFVVTAEGADGEEELFRGRDFSVKGEHFPRLKSPRELAEPLVYLMNKREYEELMSIENSDTLKEAIDRFWLENIGSISRAKRVISLYYERVEEANKQFTGFKEGWKTDRGMVYILFGPPLRIERWLNAQQWLGSSYGSGDPHYNFLFRRTRKRSNYFPFDNYILQRSPGYHTYQYQQTQLWLTGHILVAYM